MIVVDPPRDPTPEERAILDFVIEANPEHREALRALLRDTKVTALCPCGCGSPSLTVDGAAIDRGVKVPPWKLPGEAAWKIDADVVLATLFIDSSGAELEIVHSASRDEWSGRWPRSDEIEVARWEVWPGTGGRGHSLTNFVDAEAGGDAKG